MTLTDTITIPREVIPLDDAHGWPAPPTPLKRLGSKLPEFEERAARRLRGGQEWRPARDILDREGIHLRHRRVHLRFNVNVWIVLAYVVTAIALVLTSMLSSRHLADAEPSPLTVSVMEDSPAAFTAVLLGLHGGSGR